MSQFDKYQVVVLTSTPLQSQKTIGDYCHSKGIYVVVADTFGLFGSIFCDFGEKFTVVDPTGETPLSGIVAGIDEDGLVSALDETRHGLEDGDYVTFSEIEGMEGLNACEPRKITVKGPYTFSIGDVSGLGQYKRGGMYQQVKMPKIINFKPFSAALKEPEFVMSDFAKFDRPQQLHLGFQALQAFQILKGRLPNPMDDDDAAVVLGAAEKFATEEKLQIEFDEKLLKELSYQARGDLSPMAAFFGGITAQEVLKAVSGKFQPINQWMYFDSLESLPTFTKRSPDLCKAIGSRYDGQIAVFGTEYQEKIANLTQFLVGAGAIGCEMLKNWAMMGLGTGPKGKIFVTDMDSIEKSNLNRQFLFRADDVGNMKSDCAAKAVQRMNPDLAGHIQTFKDRVSPDTENIFNEDFWQGLDGVTNALDNVEARTYVDRRCVFFHKPLLESGTLGTKGNTQVILPHLTESYSSSQDPPEKEFPMCTIRSFPNRIEHTIAWAKDYMFEKCFVKAPQTVNLYLTQPNFMETTLKQGGNQKETLETIRDYLTTDRPRTFDDCIAWARIQFETEFTNKIQQLLYNFPKDSTTSSGTPFWSGPKRAPDALKFDVNNPTHFGFVVAAANLHAFNFNIKSPGYDKSFYQRELENIIVPDFTPDSNVKIQADDKEPVSLFFSFLVFSFLCPTQRGLPDPPTLSRICTISEPNIHFKPRTPMREGTRTRTSLRRSLRAFQRRVRSLASNCSLSILKRTTTPTIILTSSRRVATCVPRTIRSNRLTGTRRNSLLAKSSRRLPRRPPSSLVWSFWSSTRSLMGRRTLSSTRTDLSISHCHSLASASPLRAPRSSTRVPRARSRLTRFGTGLRWRT